MSKSPGGGFYGDRIGGGNGGNGKSFDNNARRYTGNPGGGGFGVN